MIFVDFRVFAVFVFFRVFSCFFVFFRACLGFHINTQRFSCFIFVFFLVFSCFFKVLIFTRFRGQSTVERFSCFTFSGFHDYCVDANFRGLRFTTDDHGI